mmetsp:Transcript_23107/g.33766  ORF Transcript_23107/g.33766 Transcript_23107/m.33766 type:complete len:81 (+) Transcript_23107:518-760(+)
MCSPAVRGRKVLRSHGSRSNEDDDDSHKHQHNPGVLHRLVNHPPEWGACGSFGTHPEANRVSETSDEDAEREQHEPGDRH